MLILLCLLTALAPAPLNGQEFSASTPPKGRYLLRVFPKAFFTSAYFSNDGRALNLDRTTGLLYVEMPVQVQYGVTGALAVGAIVPLSWTYQEVRPEIRKDPVHRLAVREFWLTVQHRWLALPFISSSSLRIKIPLADKEAWEDGLRVGDGQVDVYPAYYFDYYSIEHYWFAELTLGYKYRFRSGDIKPFDEMNFRSVVGFELWGRPKMDVFLFADLTRFRNGDYGETDVFFEKEGSLHTFGYGVSFEPYPLSQIYIDTAGDFSGRNRYRGMRWTVGLRTAFGSGG
jgi:hypothetical protein